MQKHSALLKYRYWDYQEDPNSKDEHPQRIRVERIGTFESPIEGEVTNVQVRVNDEIAHAGVQLCTVQEACAHTVQYGGLCALCGKAVEDEKDYSGYTYEDRATILMAHDNTGLRILLDEATRIEQTTTDSLVTARKLILVVDLDQTVIHATVDPTVGEWQRDPQNPNYPFVRDVRSFLLEEEPVVPPGWMGPRPPPTKCWYYVKLRPGLAEFLARVSQLYELHIYTMATRNYALAIAAIIDPLGEYFGDRILSRDESGLLTHKNLRRLFPVDQSMVVIIDDRGDVWQWEANLVKVVPYDFFVGIGDINLSFLPKKSGQLVGPTKKRKTIARLEEMAEQGESFEEEEKKEKEKEKAREEGEAQDKKEPEEEEESEETATDSGSSGQGNSRDDAPTNTDNESDSESDRDIEGDTTKGAELSPLDRIVELGGGENNQNLLLEQLLTRSQSLEQQQHDRPLAKLQHNLDKIIHDHTPEPEEDDTENLLYDDDTELVSLQTALETIHSEYYEEYGRYEQESQKPRPDLTDIIPRLKSTRLSGVVVLFSGILPLGMNIDNADIVIWCRQFGVRVVNEVYADVTHVVCRDPAASFMKPGLTLKVRVARKTLPNVQIVNPDWLFACLSQWKRVAEDDYRVELPEQDWYVLERDVDKYKRNLDAQRPQGRERLLSSIEEYDFNDASAEVDDFLAGISDDDAESEDEEEDEEDEEERDEKEDEKNEEGSFDREDATGMETERLNGSTTENTNGKLPTSVYGQKRSLDVSDESQSKRVKGDDIDELEKELLDELDHLDE